MFIRILILTKNISLAERCIDSIVKKTVCSNFVINVISNNDVCQDWKAKRSVDFFFDPRDFNFSAINISAARRVVEDKLLFLNDDIEVLSKNWLNEMLKCFNNPSVGIVGAKLLYPDHAIQHAGLIAGLNDVSGKHTIVSHWHKHLPNSWKGYKKCTQYDSRNERGDGCVHDELSSSLNTLRQYPGSKDELPVFIAPDKIDFLRDHGFSYFRYAE